MTAIGNRLQSVHLAKGILSELICDDEMMNKTLMILFAAYKMTGIKVYFMRNLLYFIFIS